MKKFILLLLISPGVLNAQTTSADILAQSKQYHDPESLWPSLQATFHFTETRPSGSDRSATFEIDNQQGKWILNRNDEEVYEIRQDSAIVLKGGKEAARGLSLRNYYLYLWGLPMKLYDESTPTITRVDDQMIDKIPTYVLRVAYEKDIWYFSFDQKTGRMLQYKFYKDESAGKGELITLEEEVTYQGLKIPKKRNWYTLPEMKYLGSDILDVIK